MKTNAQTRPSGFAMLEVLISILVIAFGLLGLAGLQGFSIRNNHNAYLRSQATLLAYDIADRMRANRTGINAGAYNLGPVAAGTSACQFTSSPAACDSAALAAYDLFVWQQLLTQQLPGGRGVVCIDSAAADGTPTAPNCDGSGVNGTAKYAVKIWFTESATGPQTQFTVPFQP